MASQRMDVIMDVQEQPETNTADDCCPLLLLFIYLFIYPSFYFIFRSLQPMCGCGIIRFFFPAMCTFVSTPHFFYFSVSLFIFLFFFLLYVRRIHTHER